MVGVALLNVRVLGIVTLGEETFGAVILGAFTVVVVAPRAVVAVLEDAPYIVPEVVLLCVVFVLPGAFTVVIVLGVVVTAPDDVPYVLLLVVVLFADTPFVPVRKLLRLP